MALKQVANRIAAAVIGIAVAGPAFATEKENAAHWVVAAPAPDVPPAGRSLFEHSVVKRSGAAVTYDIPFPFDALVRYLEQRAGCKPGACARQVLIPLGRSLQRSAASPEFFVYPRVVMAIDRESDARSSLRLKDRLYLGYQEKSAIIEVISFNEAAGRFEFQLVKDYRRGSTPRIVNAARAVCVACHQNQAPLFSRQQWDETNANARVADALARTKRHFYGVPVRVGISQPNAIDDAVHRANLFSLTRLLWRDGCGDRQPEAQRCRTAALAAALQYRLSGERGFDSRSAEFTEAVAAVLPRNLARRWPTGLALPNPEIPNRDPFKFSGDAHGVQMTHIAAALEPLAPRPPLEIVASADTRWPSRLVTGLSEFLSAADMRELAARVSANNSPRKHYRSDCIFARDGNFKCTANATSLILEGHTSSAKPLSLSSLIVNGLEPLRDVQMTRSPSSNREQAVFFPASSWRLTDGNAIEQLTLNVDRSNKKGSAMLTVREDFSLLRGALDGNPQSTAALQNLARIVNNAELGSAMPDGPFPPLIAQENFSEAPAQAAPFLPACAACHATTERFPPNFLFGDATRIRAALASCTPRIFARLSMWQFDATARDKTPMPPSRIGEDAPVAVASLRDIVAAMLQTETGAQPELASMLRNGYEALRPCLPAEL